MSTVLFLTSTKSWNIFFHLSKTIQLFAGDEFAATRTDSRRSREMEMSERELLEDVHGSVGPQVPRRASSLQQS